MVSILMDIRPAPARSLASKERKALVIKFEATQEQTYLVILRIVQHQVKFEANTGGNSLKIIFLAPGSCTSFPINCILVRTPSICGSQQSGATTMSEINSLAPK